MYFDLPQLSPWVLDLARLLLGLALLVSGWRLLKGPTTADRIIAMELIAALLMAHFIIMLPVTGFLSYLDVAMAIALISFLGTVAFARYLENRKAPE